MSKINKIFFKINLKKDKESGNENNSEDNNAAGEEREDILPLEYDDPSQRALDSTNIVDITNMADGSKRSRSESDAPESETRRKRAANFPWRNGGGGSNCGIIADDSSENDENDEAYKTEQKELRSKNSTMQQNFSKQMKEKIFLLPLPENLKNYVNYYRN